MDGIGGTVINLIYRDVKSNKCILNSAKEFADYAQGRIKGINSLHLPVSDVMEEPRGIDEAPKIPEILKIHKVERCFDANKACLLKFYYLGSDGIPYYTQFLSSEWRRCLWSCDHVVICNPCL